MNWTGPADFLAMGGYGLYVWGAYAVTAACMIGDAVFASRRHRDALRARADHETEDVADDAGKDDRSLRQPAEVSA